ncbi:unnamed protein product [Urochloa humidicola]
MAVSISDPRQLRPTTTYYQQNLFVYKAHPAASPSLQLLPDSHDYWTDQGRHYGMAARRDGEFVAAAFRAAMVLADEIKKAWEEVGELTLFSSSTGQWEVVELQMPFVPREASTRSPGRPTRPFLSAAGSCASPITTAASCTATSSRTALSSRSSRFRGRDSG